VEAKEVEAGEKEEKEEKEGKTTHLKSSNPHLTGGKKILWLMTNPGDDFTFKTHVLGQLLLLVFRHTAIISR